MPFNPTLPAVLAAVLLASVGCQELDTRRSTADELFSNRKARALVKAAESGDVATIDRLVADGVDVNTQGRGGATPLFRSLVAKSKEGYLALLSHGANPNLRDHRGYAAVNESARYANSFWLKKAIEAGGDPDLVSREHPFLPNSTPIFYAIYKERSGNVDVLIQSGANLNHQDSHGMTPLHAASDHAAYDIVYMLLKAGADYRIKNQYGLDVYTYHYQGRSKGVVEKTIRGKQKVWYYKVVDFIKSDPLSHKEDQESPN